MSYDLIEYFNRRFSRPDLEKKKPEKKEPGPFVTISRETGCRGNDIAEQLVEHLKQYDSRWKLINKEIIFQAANKLKVDPHRIYDVIESENRTAVHEILDALAYKYYVNDRVVRKNVAELLRFDARQGYVVIVGRGGVAVTNDIPNGLHLKFTAPLAWRVESVALTKNMRMEEAERYVKETDAKRIKLIEQLSGKSIDQVYFDLQINCKTFTNEQFIELITQTMKIKGLI